MLNNLTTSQKLVGALGFRHLAAKVEKGAIRHEIAGLALSQHVSLTAKGLSLPFVLVVHLVQLLMNVHQFLRPVRLVILLDIRFINLHFLADHCASRSHEVLWHPLVVNWLRTSLHFLSSLIHVEYLVKLILLTLRGFCLFLSFHFFQLLVKHPR